MYFVALVFLVEACFEVNVSPSPTSSFGSSHRRRGRHRLQVTKYQTVTYYAPPFLPALIGVGGAAAVAVVKLEHLFVAGAGEVIWFSELLD